LTITGYAGGRLNQYLARFEGTPVGRELEAISYFGGLRFNRSRGIRLDLNAINRVVEVFENSDYGAYIARNSVQEYLENSLRLRNSENARRASRWLLNNNILPEMIGVAAYLRHGRPAFTPNPVRDLIIALRLGHGKVSWQLAILFKLHAQRIFRARNYGPESSHAHSATTQRLPRKTPHFVRTMNRNRGADFQFDFASSRQIIPCIDRGEWRHSRSRPNGVFLRYREGDYYDFGQAIPNIQ
jgi:ribosomal protein S19